MKVCFILWRDLPHFMGFITAGLDVLKSLKDGGLGKDFSHKHTHTRIYKYVQSVQDFA